MVLVGKYFVRAAYHNSVPLQLGWSKSKRLRCQKAAILSDSGYLLIGFSREQLCGYCDFLLEIGCCFDHHNRKLKADPEIGYCEKVAHRYRICHFFLLNLPEV